MAEKIKVKIGHMPITDHLILGITKDKLEKGAETFKHLDLETVIMSGWPDLVRRFDNQELDGAFMLAPSAMDLFRAGVGMRMVLLGHKTGSIFIKRRGAGINTIADFKGTTIIIPFQMSVHFMLLHQMLTQAGLEPHKDVKFETLAPAQMPEALEYGEEDKIGGFIVAEPFGSISLKAGHGDVFALSKDLWPGHPCCVLVVKEDLVRNNPDAVQELVNSLVDSGKLAKSRVEEAAEVGARFLKQDKALIQSILTEPKDRIMTEELLPRHEDFEKMQNYMCDSMKVLKGKVDLEKMIDLRFAKEAGAV